MSIASFNTLLIMQKSAFFSDYGISLMLFFVVTKFVSRCASIHVLREFQVFARVRELREIFSHKRVKKKSGRKRDTGIARKNVRSALCSESPRIIWYAQLCHVLPSIRRDIVQTTFSWPASVDVKEK